MKTVALIATISSSVADLTKCAALMLFQSASVLILFVMATVAVQLRYAVSMVFALVLMLFAMGFAVQPIKPAWGWDVEHVIISFAMIFVVMLEKSALVANVVALMLFVMVFAVILDKFA
jgi:hypothetical protein